MNALILAAGYATRLYPLTKEMPKSLLKIKDRPILDFIVDRVEQVRSLDKVIVASNNKFYSHFQGWLKSKPAQEQSRCHLINDGSNTVDDRLGAVGDMKLVIHELKLDDDLLVVAGDNIFDFDLNEFVEFGKQKRPYHSIGLYLADKTFDLSRYGIAQITEDAQVLGFEEKPAHPRSNLIATCIYYFPKEKLHLVDEYLTNGHHKDTPGSYISWLAQHDRVYGRIFDGTWLDLGDFESLAHAAEIADSF